MDTEYYPGDATMDWLKANTNLVWCAYYLGPTPSHDDDGWMGQRAALTGAGWGLAPVYVGQQLAGPGSHNVNGPQGTTDGLQAGAMMSGEGFAPGAYVYLDLEDGPPYAAPRTTYVSAWVAAVTGAGFSPGIYCSHLIAAAVRAAAPVARIWAFRVNTTAAHAVPGTNFPDPAPSGSGFAGAYMWQRDDNAQIDVDPPNVLVVDLDSSVGPDPSAP
jgi:hypothetical protein